MHHLDRLSPDDLAARRAKNAEDDRLWLDAYRLLRPTLWFVLRHSGRSGERWRVVFQSRSKAEAETFYTRKAYPRHRSDITYAATELYEGGLTWDCKRVQCGGAPLDGSVPIHIDDELKTARARDEREERVAKRLAKRTPTAPTPPTDAEQAEAVDYAAFRKAYPATRCFERYTHEQRATHAASHRLGRRQQEAVGEFYYTHEMLPGQAFPSAKGATTMAFAVYQARPKARIQVTPTRIAVGAGDEAQAAELEGVAVDEASVLSRSTVRYETGL